MWDLESYLKDRFLSFGLQILNTPGYEEGAIYYTPDSSRSRYFF